MEARLLALDTSTDRLAIGLGVGACDWLLDEPGGASASARLIGAIHELLEHAGQSLGALDAIAFGAGPGAFTGLRSACAVAQGLAFGLGKPVIALDSLMLVAEDVRRRMDAASMPIWIAMDARMDEIYAACYHWRSSDWAVLSAPALWSADALARRWQAEPPAAVAGSALGVFGDRLPTGAAPRWAVEADRAGALLSLARRAWQHGRTLDAAAAAPLYLRDKVALTSAEREAAAAARAGR